MKKPNQCNTVPGFVTSPAWQKKAYKELCKQYFADDAMPDADAGEITFGQQNSPNVHAFASCSFRREVTRGLGGVLQRKPMGPNEFLVKGFIIGRISINFCPLYNVAMTEKDAYETLIHEMIHVWQYLNESSTEWAANPHGRGFLIKSRQARADGWDIGIRGIGSTRPQPLSARERLAKKYGH